MVEVEDIYPLSATQRGMLFHDLYSPNEAMYVVQVHLRLHGPLDVDGYRAAWERLMRRHGVLRTAFVWENLEEPVQVVRGDLPVPLTVEDWAELEPALVEERIDLLIEDERNSDLDLRRGPLFRVRLVRLSAEPEESHQVVWTFHHILLDGWSLTQLLGEFNQLYAAEASGNEARLVELRRSYGEYIQWARERPRAAAEAHWRDVVRAIEQPCILAPERLPASSNGDRYRSQAATWDAASTRALLVAAQRMKVSLAAVVQAAWALTLARNTRQRDVVFGTTVSGRAPELSGIEDVVGLFIGTLPLVVRYEPTLTLGDWVGRVQDRLLSTVEHDCLALSDVLAFGPFNAENKLFDSICVFENYPADGASWERLGQLRISHVGFNERTNFPLTVVAEVRGCLSVQLMYETERFDAHRIARLLEQLDAALKAFSGDPEQLLGDIELVTGNERRLLAHGAQPEPRFFAADARIHELFEACVARRPTAIAATSGEAHVTYSELGALSARVQAALAEAGVEPGARVALCLDPSVELLAGIFGTLRAGAAYVPLDPRYPSDRLAFILEDAAPRVVLTTRAAVRNLPESAARVVYWDELELSAGADVLRPVALPAHAPAYVIYTSGSTGRPKGVVVTHHNVVRLLRSTEKWFDFGPGDVWTLFHSPSFDFSVWEMFGALCYGGRVVLVPHAVSRSPGDFLDLLSRERVTVLNQTPSAFKQLMLAEAAREQAAELSLRWLIFGGEALEYPILAGWFERHGEQARVVNMYGITETTVHVTYREIKPGDATSAKGSFIGLGIPDLSVHVLDEAMQRVPVGAPGELYVGGDGVSLGYLARPSLAAARFVPDPFSGRPGARLYRTGDLARFLPEGELQYLGRIDAQVKLRGFRVELGEIESQLLDHPTVGECAVVLREDEPGQKALVAYCVGRNGETPEPALLREHLSSRLPEHMVPAAFVRLGALPITINGKLDRDALPRPDALALARHARRIAPRTPTEQAIAAAWQKALGVADVSVTDSYFDLGGDSILSLKVQTSLRRAGFALTLRDLFEYPTLEGLAAYLEGDGRAVAAQAEREQLAPFALVPASEREVFMRPGVVDAYPLSALQAGMVFHSADDEDDAASSTYHDVFTYEIEGTFVEAHLRAAIGRAVRTHAVLRTAYDFNGGSEAYQVVHQAATCSLVVTDLRGRSEQEQAQALAAWLESEKRTPFDWSRPPLLRLFVHLVDDAGFRLSLSFHHSILDGWSVATLVTALLSHMDAAQNGVASALGLRPSSSFAELVRLERDAAASQAARAHWRAVLHEATPSLVVPYGRRAGEVTDVAGEIRVLPASLVEAVETFAKVAGVPVKAVFLAAHVKVVATLSGATDVVTGLVSNGRPEGADGERVLGLFLNTLPFRVSIGDESWPELVRRVFDAERAGLPHRRYPLALIQKEQAGGNLFDSVFNYVRFHVYAELASEAGYRIAGAGGFEQTNFPFVCSIEDDLLAGCTRLRLTGSTAHLSPAELSDVADRYFLALTTLAAQTPGARASSALLLPYEAASLLRGGDAPASAPPAEPAHRLVERIAAARPRSLAIRSAGESMTYAELNDRADSLAESLVKGGVGVGAPIAVLLERSPGLAVAQLAALKSGGYFVPLDVAHPPRRLRDMLADAGAAFVITSRMQLARVQAAELPVRVLLVDEPDARAEPLPPKRSSSLDAIAYAIFTSGTTGRPKAVLIPQRGLANLIGWHERAFRLDHASRTALIAAPAFDASVWELWPSLSTGASIHIPDEATRLDPERLQQWLLSERITSCFVPTPLAEQLLELDWPAECQLQFLLTGGDRLSARPETALPFALVNNYGPTEFAVVATSGVVTPGAASTPPDIGKPIDGARVQVLDANLEPVPLGVAGELYLGGASLSAGYLHRPALTAASFIPDPGSGRGERMYRTGDIVRRLRDGRLEFVGRRDHQVKIRGLRIELGEIESVLRGCSGVGSSCVVVREDRPRSKRLVAYVVPTEAERGVDTRAWTQSLKRALAERLPDYMVPQDFVVLGELPLTSNDKVDRAALPRPPQPTEPELTLARDETEAELCRVFAEVLGLERVGVFDNFFELGGDSIMSIRIVSKARQRGLHLKSRHIFECQTVALLAPVVRRARDGQPTGPGFAAATSQGDAVDFDSLLSEIQI